MRILIIGAGPTGLGAAYSYASWLAAVDAAPNNQHWLWNAKHNGGANVLYLDGHVKYMTHRNVTEDMWNPAD